MLRIGYFHSSLAGELSSVDLMQTPMDRRKFVRYGVALLLGFGGTRMGSGENAKPAANPLNEPIERKAVTSTSIAGIGYHPRLQVLEIEFRSGAVYRYLAVPPAVYEALMKAESKGRYFAQHVRSQFTFHRMKEPRP